MKRLSRALFLVAFLAGCSGQSAEPRARLVPASVEVITVADQARAAIAATPTEFVLSVPEDRLAWSRARDFFALYAGSPVGVDSEQLLSNRGVTTSGYFFEIERVAVDRGARFSVRCFPAHGAAIVESSIQNARNVARFLRDGVLEVSLLAK